MPAVGWREQFREDNQLLMKLVGGWRGRIYVYITALTFAYQCSPRWSLCSGLVACSLSFLKGIAWSLVWPFYWINHLTDFILFHPYKW